MKKPPESRLFFALWPDPETRARLQQIASRLPAHRGRAGHPLDWHVTLVFLGPVGQDRRPCVEEVASKIRGEPFELRVDRVGCWRRPRILWCGSSNIPDTLARLVTDLQTGLVSCGFRPEKRPYAPHVTLVRKASPIPDQDLDTPLHWPVREFVLAGSHGVAEPPRYQLLRRWKLKG